MRRRAFFPQGTNADGPSGVLGTLARTQCPSRSLQTPAIIELGSSKYAVSVTWHRTSAYGPPHQHERSNQGYGLEDRLDLFHPDAATTHTFPGHRNRQAPCRRPVAGRPTPIAHPRL